MTERSAADDALVLAYVDGTLDAPLRAEVEARLAREPALRAEIEGLQAIRALLDQDARFGRQSGIDEPPPQLLDAILRAEVVARPEEIRQAVALQALSPQEQGKKPLWARLSSWLVGGGVVVGAAAAVLVLVTRGDQALTVLPPSPATAPLPASSPAVGPGSAPAPETSAPPPAPEPSSPAEPPADRAHLSEKPAVAAQAEPPRDVVSETRSRRPALEQARGGELDRAQERAAGDGAADDAEGRGAPAHVVHGEARADEDESSAGLATADTAEAPAKKAEAPSTAVPAAAPPPPPAPASPASPPKNRAEFLERLKSKAQEETTKKLGGPPGTQESARKAREELERAKVQQEANLLLVTAERELARGRPAEALDFALRAETLDRSGALGGFPAALQARAFLALHRPADSARVASRLLQAEVLDPGLVDGLLAGADAAVAIGDHRLAARLLRHVLASANTDKARRDAARARLEQIASQKSLRRSPAAADAAESKVPAATSSPQGD